jgi:hypothetical protein
MGNLSKGFCIFLVVILSVSSLFIAKSAYAQTFPKPSVPEFTVRIVSYPYDVPPTNPTYTINPYTGDKEQATSGASGYHVENKSIEIVIENQPFTPYNLTSYTVNFRDRDDFSRTTSYTFNESKTVNFYYNIEVKGHFEDNWQPVETKYIEYEGPVPNAQLDSPYTVISLPANYPERAVLDFRVQARIGYYYPYGPSVLVIGYDFYGEESNWSKIQTLNTTAGTPSEIPNPPATQTEYPNPTITTTPTPVNFDLSLNQSFLTATIIVGIVFAVAAAALIYFKRRRKSELTETNSP